MPEQQEILPRLFRTEFGKITSVLSKLMGMQHSQAAEDITSETFLAALDTWPYKGIPENPTAWLYAVAKNKAKNYIQRKRLFRNKVTTALQKSAETNMHPEIDLSDKNINDSQLQMLFAICHPCITSEAQVGLSLRILCGFGIDEIANAFLTNREAINKRLFRAKEKLRVENVEIRFPDEHEITLRLDSVLTTLYLLYNEGYYSESEDIVLREDLCLEAMRLIYLLVQYEPTNKPVTNALFALMCFHSSRFKARKNHLGEMILYQDQDESLWNIELITRGAFYLHQASNGNEVSKYHIQAGIAYWHTIKTDTPEKWVHILQLYNHLLKIEYSPMAALNRTFAVSKVLGKQAAIIEAEKLQLTGNHYYHTLLGELYRDSDHARAMLHYEEAFALAKTQADKKIIATYLQLLRP